MKKTIVSFIVVALLAPVLVAQAGQKGGGRTVAKTFKVAADTKILTSEGKAGALADLKVGDKVGLVYKDAAGAMTAEKIHVMSEAKGQGRGKKGEGRKGEKPEGGALRAHGVIASVDAAAGAITVDVREGRKKQ